MSPRSTTLPLYFWNFGSNSAFFRWHKSINEAKWTLSSFFCASSMTSFLLLTFFTSHAAIVSSFFPFLVHCCLCIWNLHRLRHRNKFMHQIVMQHRILPCSRDVFFVNLFVTDSNLSLVDSWASVIQLNLVLVSDALAFSVIETTVSRMYAWGNALLHGIAAAFWCFQLSPCILNDVFVFFVTRVNRINSSQISGVFEFRFLDCPFLFFLFFERLFQFLSKRQAICDLDVMSFGFYSISLQTTYILFEEFRSMMWISWNQSTNPTVHLCTAPGVSFTCLTQRTESA